ncbi:hypothetical protein Ndes2437B_g01976 [Nannochloris sp. 'desiccata']
MRMSDGTTTEAGHSIRNEFPALVGAKQLTGKCHKGKFRDQQNDPDKTVGIKRKADEIECALGAEEGPSTSKRQLLGLNFISTALKTLNPLKNISNFMKWGRGEVEARVEAPQPSLQEEPTSAAVDGDGAAATKEPFVVVIEDFAVAEPLVETEVEDEVLEIADEEESLEEIPTAVTAPPALPVNDDTTTAPFASPAENVAAAAAPIIQHNPETAATILPVLPSTNRPDYSIFRQTSHYSPPVAKAIKVVKRSELKRQLREQRAPNPSTNVSAAPAPARRGNNPSGNKSRGSRLLTMAHDKAPLTVVSMAIAPPCKTPRAAFGLYDIIITPPARVQQQELQAEGEGGEHLDNGDNQQGQEQVVAPEVATIPVALEPSPEARTRVETHVEEVEELLESAHIATAAAAADVTAGVAAAPAAAEPTDPPSRRTSGSPLSLALWGIDKPKETEPEESHGTAIVKAARISAALALMPEIAAAIAVGENETDDDTIEVEDEAVAAEIDERAAVVSAEIEATAAEEEDTTPLQKPEVVVVEAGEEDPLEAPAFAAENDDKEDADGKEEEEKEVLPRSTEDVEDNVEKGEEDDAAAALFDGGHGNQFTPLPRLLPRWGISSGSDSAATSPSSFCSLLPVGISGGRNPSYKISQPGATAPAAANSPSVALRSNKSTNGKNDDADDMNDGAASTHPGGNKESSGRRVRFFGVEEISKEEENNDQELLISSQQQQHQDGEGGEQREIVCRPSIRPLPPPVCRPSSSNGRTHLTGAQPRFGIGAFVRIPANTTNGNAATVTQQNKEGSPPDAGTTTVAAALESTASPIDGIEVVENTSPPARVQVNTDQENAIPLVITRRLQHSGTLLRRAAPLLPPPLPAGDSIPQLLREAFLNARLTEHWCRGEAWARLDLSGIELVRDGDREAHLGAVIATLTGQRGDTAVQTALDQLQIEWELLKCFRQKYVSSPTEKGTIATAAAPKSILKHASGVSPLSAAAAAAAGGGAAGADSNYTPPLERKLPGFEDILAAEIVPGSTSPLDWAIGAIGAIAGLGNHTGQLTPGITVRSRGIKMLASLHHQAAAAANAGSSPPEGANAPGSGQNKDGVGAVATRAATAAAAAAAAEEQQNQHIAQQQPAPAVGAAEGRRRRFLNGTRRAGSRGHRLLQALQNAAGPNTSAGGGHVGAIHNTGAPTTAAAAAARLIVDSSTAGGDGGDFLAGPMATSFVIN